MNFQQIFSDVKTGQNVKLASHVNHYGCITGENSRPGAFVEVRKGSIVGKNCKISSHCFIGEGVVIEDDVFAGYSVSFINDLYFHATDGNGEKKGEKERPVISTLVKKDASIGSGSTILCGVKIGKRSIVGAGSTVAKDVPDKMIVAGNPARILRRINER